MASSFFQDVEAVPVAEVFRLLAQYREDSNPNKVNLGVGAYRTEEGKPWVLPVVSSTEVAMAADKTLNHEYLTIDGMKEFSNAAIKLALGADSPAIVENRVCAVQALSGTGSLRLVLEFTRRFFPTKVAYTSIPTWGNHKKVARDAGYADQREYRYFNKETKGLDLNGMIEDLQNAPESSIIILHGCAHNPTGVDPTSEQWEKIASVIKEKHLFPVMDYAYLGLVSGDPDTDARALRYFVQQGIELSVAMSFAKNFGLYSERIGCAFFVVNDTGPVEPIRSQLKGIIRPMWSNPPAHGARIVTTILSNPALLAEWKECVQTMSKRILAARDLLFQKIREMGTPGNWEHIIKQCGMFTFTGLTGCCSQVVDHVLSVQRSVYKDLVCLLNANRLLKLEELKEKGEESFQGDTLLEGGVKTGLHNGTDYKEVRKFTHGKTVVMFYFVTRCYNEYMQSILDEFKLDPPHVIIMNSCLWDLHRYGKTANNAFISNIPELLEAIDLAVPYDDRLFIWNATLPVRETVKAGFLPPGVSQTLPAEDIRKANLYVRDQLKQLGKRFLFLDLHQVFYRHLNRRVKDGVHWDDFAHRKITCLLLTEISKCWDFEVPASKAPIPPVLSEIPSANFMRPMSAIPVGTPPFPPSWRNGPVYGNHGYPSPELGYSLNTTFPPFSRKRKYVEDNGVVDSYKYPRKFM